MKKVVALLSISVVVGAFLLSIGCSKPVKTTLPVQAAKDTVLPDLGSEIYYSASFGGTTRSIKNDDQFKGNGVDSAWVQACGASKQLKGQHFHFMNFPDTSRVYSIYFSVYKCAATFNDSIDKDSMFVVGNLPYGSAAAGKEGVVVKWIDNLQTVWSTELSPNLATDQASSTFNITDVAINEDGFSRFLIGGTFTCTLFDKDGNTLNVTDGKFVSRAGRHY